MNEQNQENIKCLIDGYDALFEKIMEIQYDRLKVSGQKLTEVDNKEILKEVAGFYYSLSQSKDEIQKYFINVILHLEINQIKFRDFHDLVTFAAYLQLVDEGKIESNEDSKVEQKCIYNLENLRNQFSGTRFCHLIEAHLRKGNSKSYQQAVLELVNELPSKANKLVEGYIDGWLVFCDKADFWQTDTSRIFDSIVSDAKTLLEENKIKYNDDILFNMFQIIVLSYAYSAYDQPKMRELMGIKRKKIFGLF